MPDLYISLARDVAFHQRLFTLTWNVRIIQPLALQRAEASQFHLSHSTTMCKYDEFAHFGCHHTHHKSLSRSTINNIRCGESPMACTLESKSRFKTSFRGALWCSKCQEIKREELVARYNERYIDLLADKMRETKVSEDVATRYLLTDHAHLMIECAREIEKLSDVYEGPKVFWGSLAKRTGNEPVWPPTQERLCP